MAFNFDLSTVYDNKVIKKAELFLYNKTYVIEAAGNPSCSLFTIEKEWDESGFTWNNAKTDLPWENIDNSSGLLGGGDHGVEAVAVTTCNGIEKWFSFDITNLVKEIVKGNSIKGLLLKEVLNGSELDVCEGITIASSEADEIVLRPKLIIEYEDTPITFSNTNIKNILKIKETNNDIKISKLIKNVNEAYIYSVSGKLVKTFTFVKNSIFVDKNNYSKGTYFLKLNGKEHISYKIIIN